MTEAALQAAPVWRSCACGRIPAFVRPRPGPGPRPGRVARPATHAPFPVARGLRPFSDEPVFPSVSERDKTERVKDDQVRTAVRSHYAEVAKGTAGGCAPGCCGATPEMSLRLGYAAEDLAAVPEGANMGLGCGNPRAIAALREGQTVLDLGSGGGFDCFLAARQVGEGGRVIGVDMTPEMVAKARANASTLGSTNVEFRLGEIEHLPVADGTVDVILSNCVVNLAPDKAQVFREAFRVLAPGGRLAISDVVAEGELPGHLQGDAALSGCIAGAARAPALEAMLLAAGFEQVTVTTRPESREFIRDWFPGSGAEAYVVSATIEATKPRVGSHVAPKGEPLTSEDPEAGGRACCGPSCCEGEAPA